jgi:hypothetical protein
MTTIMQCCVLLVWGCEGYAFSKLLAREASMAEGVHSHKTFIAHHFISGKALH